MSEQSGGSIRKQVDARLREQRLLEIEAARIQTVDQQERDQRARVEAEFEGRIQANKRAMTALILSDIVDLAGLIRDRGLVPAQEVKTRIQPKVESGTTSEPKGSVVGRFIRKALGDSWPLAPRAKLLSRPIIYFAEFGYVHWEDHDRDGGGDGYTYKIAEKKMGFFIDDGSVVAHYPDSDSVSPDILPASAEDLFPSQLLYRDTTETAEHPVARLYREQLVDIGAGLVQGRIVTPLFFDMKS